MRKLSDWTQEYSSSESIDILREIARTCAEGVQHPLGPFYLKCIERCDFKALLTAEVPLEEIAREYGVCELHSILQVKALFSAFEDLTVPGVDPEMACLLDLLASEAHCRETNELFRAEARGTVAFPPWFAGVLYSAQRWVARIVGPCPSLGDLGLRFGPGATTRTKKRMASIKRKLGDGVSCSDDLLGYAQAILSEVPAFADLNASHVSACGEDWRAVVSVSLETGVMTLINKNWKKKRTTETQPVLNGLVQNAIGDYLKDRRCVLFPGLDLADQTLNRVLARVGSLTGEVATLDQSSASNYLARVPALSLFPADWASLLNAVRCGVTRVPYLGSMKLEMLAGMGCGFTFPVQSIVFYALAKGVAEVMGHENAIVSVYGDDVIVDTELAEPLMEALKLFGLRVNADKSFWAGDFRESCGADFYLGTDVRPVFCKEVLTPARLFVLHNGFVRRGFPHLAEKVRHLLHPSLVLWGPDGYGDGHLIREDWQSFAKRHENARHGFEGYVFDTFAKTAKRHWDWHPGDYILPSYSIYRRGAVPVVPAFDPPAHQSAAVWQAKYRRAIGDPVDVTPIPFSESPPPGGDDGRPRFVPWGPKQLDSDGLLVEGWAKAATFPGEDGYRRISVYTLRG